MKKSWLTIIIGVIALGLIAYLVLKNNSENTQESTSTQQPVTAPAPSEPAPAEDEIAQSTELATETAEVTIQNFAFGPQTLTVKKGTTVTWTNQDSDRHDITPDTPSDNFQASNLLGRGQSYSVTFDELGSYSYHCSPHPYMKGTVVVTE